MAANDIVTKAAQKWKSHEKSRIDDITCVVIFLGRKLILRNYSEKELLLYRLTNDE